MEIQPYLFFDGRCDEAIAFYTKAVGAKTLMLLRHKDSPEPASIPPGMAEKIMHATLSIGQSTVNVSDGHCMGKPNFDGFSLSLVVESAAQSAQYFNGLSESGQVVMPLSKTFFSPSFGMVKDKFGVMWMVYAKP